MGEGFGYRFLEGTLEVLMGELEVELGEGEDFVSYGIGVEVFVVGGVEGSFGVDGGTFL